MRRTIGEGGQRGGWGRAVSQLNGGRDSRAAVLYIPLSLQAAELGSAGHASPPAWTLPISGSDRCSRTGEGGRGGALEDRFFCRAEEKP